MHLFIVVQAFGEILDFVIITSSMPPPKLLGESSEANVDTYRIHWLGT
jgi:hypothetical protein